MDKKILEWNDHTGIATTYGVRKTLERDATAHALNFFDSTFRSSKIPHGKVTRSNLRRKTCYSVKTVRV
jgi:hypothetical protein